MASIILMLLSAWIFSGTDGFIEQNYLYILSMFLENLVFVGSISPFALYTVSTASMLLQSGDFVSLIIGYFFAITSNLASFLLGCVVRKSTNLTTTGFRKILLTFWHPQLAAITAYEAGNEGGFRELPHYLLRCIPVSAAYYILVCALLFSFPIKVSTTTSFLLPCAMITLWLILDLLHVVKKG
jgi:hypothetical protein